MSHLGLFFLKYPSIWPCPFCDCSISWCSYDILLLYIFIWLCWVLVAVCGIFYLRHENCWLRHVSSSSLTRDWTQGRLHWEHGVLATGPPGKFLTCCFYFHDITAFILICIVIKLIIILRLQSCGIRDTFGPQMCCIKLMCVHIWKDSCQYFKNGRVQTKIWISEFCKNRTWHLEPPFLHDNDWLELSSGYAYYQLDIESESLLLFFYGTELTLLLF